MPDLSAVPPPLLQAIANRKRYAAKRHLDRATELRAEADEYEAELAERRALAS